MADAKRKRAAGDEPEKEGGYVRLAPSVAKFMGVKYCKESELTLSRLLSYERSKGRISECLELVRITSKPPLDLRSIHSLHNTKVHPPF